MQYVKRVTAADDALKNDIAQLLRETITKAMILETKIKATRPKWLHPEQNSPVMQKDT